MKHSNAQNDYLPQLDILRFIAFSLVFLVHTFPSDAKKFPIFGDFFSIAVGSGGFGVDVFFCLSSFLITSLLLSEQKKKFHY